MAVFDASIVVALVVKAPWSEEARRLLAQDTRPIAPAFLMIELASALWKNTRRAAVSAERAIDALHKIPSALDLQPDGPLIESAMRIAISANHSVYDSLYLALARREGVSLLTADKDLAAVATRLGIDVGLLN